MTALLLDVGNSRLKWGVLDDDNIRRTGHIAHESIRERGLQELTSKLPRRVDADFPRAERGPKNHKFRVSSREMF